MTNCLGFCPQVLTSKGEWPLECIRVFMWLSNALEGISVFQCSNSTAKWARPRAHTQIAMKVHQVSLGV